MEESSAYEQHLRFMQNVFAVDKINESDLLQQFDLLLSCLPNGGKLYKYRSLCGKSFKYAYDSLVNGYMWIAPANTLNDDFDSTMIADAESEGKRFMDYIMRDHAKTLHTLVKQRGRQYWDEDILLRMVSFDLFLEVFDSVSGEMDDSKIVQLLCLYKDAEAKLDRIRSLFVRLIDDLRLGIDQHIYDLFHANSVIQGQNFVFSMSESYDLGNMWGYYADSGRGFCIEYDYNLVKEQDLTAMRYLLNTYKVIYSDVPREIPAEVLAEASFFDPDNHLLREQINHHVMERILYKDRCWENEKEWRIVLGNTQPRMPVDIVSAIIIDERSLEKTNAKKLMRLCKKRGWQIKVRKNHLFDTSHSYETLECMSNNADKTIPKE